MTREDILLIQLSEECSEVTQNISKALRFGVSEVYAKIGESNAVRITKEMEDLIGVYTMLVEEGVLPNVSPANVAKKQFKVNEYIKYSKQLGIIK